MLLRKNNSLYEHIKLVIVPGPNNIYGLIETIVEDSSVFEARPWTFTTKKVSGDFDTIQTLFLQKRDNYLNNGYYSADDIIMPDILMSGMSISR